MPPKAKAQQPTEEEDADYQPPVDAGASKPDDHSWPQLLGTPMSEHEFTVYIRLFFCSCRGDATDGQSGIGGSYPRECLKPCDPGAKWARDALYMLINTSPGQLQRGLAKMIGTSSGFLESLPMPIKKRIEYLQELETDYDKLEVELDKEIAAIEAKYKALFGEWARVQTPLLPPLWVMEPTCQRSSPSPSPCSAHPAPAPRRDHRRHRGPRQPQRGGQG